MRKAMLLTLIVVAISAGGDEPRLTSWAHTMATAVAALCVMLRTAVPSATALNHHRSPERYVRSVGPEPDPVVRLTTGFSGDGSKAKYPVTLPAIGTITSAHDANTVILFCLSCHDGVTATVGMMKGQTVETLPIVGGNAPTLLAKAAPSGGWAYSNDHPVGGSATVSCNPAATPDTGYNWDCTGGGNYPDPDHPWSQYGYLPEEQSRILLECRQEPARFLRWDDGQCRNLHHLPQPTQHDRGFRSTAITTRPCSSSMASTLPLPAATQ